MAPLLPEHTLVATSSLTPLASDLAEDTGRPGSASLGPGEQRRADVQKSGLHPEPFYRQGYYSYPNPVFQHERFLDVSDISCVPELVAKVKLSPRTLNRPQGPECHDWIDGLLLSVVAIERNDLTGARPDAG